LSLKNDATRKRKPIHPGEMLREDFLPDFSLSPAELGLALGVSRQTIYELLNEKRALSPQMALRLAKLFGNQAQFWLQAQQQVDLWLAANEISDDIKKIKPLNAA
jgi:addiction module HigA family antidote